MWNYKPDTIRVAPNTFNLELYLANRYLSKEAMNWKGIFSLLGFGGSAMFFNNWLNQNYGSHNDPRPAIQIMAEEDPQTFNDILQQGIVSDESLQDLVNSQILSNFEAEYYSNLRRERYRQIEQERRRRNQEQFFSESRPQLPEVVLFDSQDIENEDAGNIYIHQPGTEYTVQDMDRLLELIKDVEGFRSMAYYDPSGVLTIGYGFTRVDIPDLEIGDTMSRERADRVLIRIMNSRYIPQVRSMVRVPLTDNQLIALTSLIYNIGETAFRRSTLLRSLNNGNYDEAAEEFSNWIRGGGEILPGLVDRRNREIEIFQGG